MGPRDGLDIFRREKFIPPTGIRTPDPIARSLVSVHTTLPWLVTHYYVPRDKGRKGDEREACQPSPCILEVKNAWEFSHSPIFLHELLLR